MIKEIYAAGFCSRYGRMNNLLTQHFKAFTDSRISCSQLRLENNTAYQKALDTIDTDAGEDIGEIVNDAISIAENSAYLQRLHDGLAIMAGLSV